jgi:hypothetical protein
MVLPEGLFTEFLWDTRVWMLGGVVIVIGLLLLGDWLRTGWMTNVIRNHLEAKRRLRRQGRGPTGNAD